MTAEAKKYAIRIRRNFIKFAAEQIIQFSRDIEELSIIEKSYERAAEAKKTD